MIKKCVYWFVWLLLVGCGVDGGMVVEETAVFTSPTGVVEAALVEVTATSVATVAQGEGEMSGEGNVVRGTAVAAGGTAVAAGSVDLSKLTPSAPGATSEPRVMPAPGVPDPLAKLQHEAAQDLAQRLGVDVSEVELVEAVSTEWRDSSLGCPKRGMMYAQVITPGYQLVLGVAGKAYFYHTSGTGSFVFCEGGKRITAVNE